MIHNYTAFQVIRLLMKIFIEISLAVKVPSNWQSSPGTCANVAFHSAVPVVSGHHNWNQYIKLLINNIYKLYVKMCMRTTGREEHLTCFSDILFTKPQHLWSVWVYKVHKTKLLIPPKSILSSPIFWQDKQYLGFINPSSGINVKVYATG